MRPLAAAVLAWTPPAVPRAMSYRDTLDIGSRWATLACLVGEVEADRLVEQAVREVPGTPETLVEVIDRMIRSRLCVDG